MPAPEANRRIFAACKDLGLDEEARRDIQVRLTGKASLADMTDAEKGVMINELKAKGWKPSGHRRRPAAQRKDQRFIFVLWRLLVEAGVVSPGERALRAFINSQNFAAKWGEAVSDPNMMSAERCYDVIEALKNVAARNGVKVERR
jgi:hypothetical protein